MQKTEAVLLTTRKKLETIRVEVDGHVIESAPHLRYLEEVKDARMTFQQHLNSASERAMKITAKCLKPYNALWGPNL